MTELEADSGWSHRGVVSAYQGGVGPGPSEAGVPCPDPPPGLFLLLHLQFADTPGNLPSSLNLSQLLGLKKNISIHLAYQ